MAVADRALKPAVCCALRPGRRPTRPSRCRTSAKGRQCLKLRRDLLERIEVLDTLLTEADTVVSCWAPCGGTMMTRPLWLLTICASSPARPGHHEFSTRG